MKDCDLVIVGGGPAGLSAAVNAASEGLRVAILDRSSNGLGGQAHESSAIENYPGFPKPITGVDLANLFKEQAIKFGTDILCPTKVVGLGAEGPKRIVTTEDGEQIATNAVILACGLSYKRLDAKNVTHYLGSGVQYGSPTRGVTGGKRNVFIVGGANSAGQAACAFAKNPEATVTMLVRGQALADSMSQYLVERIEELPNVRVWYQTEVAEVLGKDGVLAELVLKKQGKLETVPADAVHIYIGGAPKTYWLNGLVERDAKGFILSGSQLSREKWTQPREPFEFETSMPGIFAAGDVRLSRSKRIAVAVGEGGVAVQSVHAYLQTLHAALVKT